MELRSSGIAIPSLTVLAPAAASLTHFLRAADWRRRTGLGTTLQSDKEHVAPIFMVGSGRSGSSVFHDILSHHPHIAWLSEICNRYPKRPWANKLIVRLSHASLVGQLVRRRFGPGECYSFWEYYARGFRTPFRDLLAEDATEKQQVALRQALTRAHASDRDKLLVKLTGWPRIGFLRKIFPGAKFIHLVRDGRAVANSLLSVDWWWGWRGPGNWRFGDLGELDRSDWERNRQSFVALAGIEWKLILAAVEQARASLAPDTFLQIRYEDLCADPVAVVHRAMEFFNVPRSATFERHVSNRNLVNRNDKWKQHLTEGQQQVLMDVIGPQLLRYGYE